MEGIFRIVEKEDWVFITLMSVFFVIALSRWIFARNFSGIFHLENFTNISVNSWPFTVLYNIIFSVLVSLLIFPFFNKPSFLEEYNLITFVGFVFCIVLLFLLLRLLISGLVFMVIDKLKRYTKFLRRKTFFRVWLVFFLAVGVFLYYYLPASINRNYIFFILLSLGIVLAAIEYVQQYKAMGKEHNLSLYYIILYLCAFEILPFLFILKQWLGWELI